MNNLHVDSVIKNFGTKQILTDIFISCTKGEVIGLFGRNGTGKSSLLKIIFGSLPAESKFVKVNGKLINGVFCNRKLTNYLPQDSFLPNHLKIEKIIRLFCDKSEINKVKSHKWIKDILHKRTNEISGGEKRLLEILIILHSGVPYVLIDEPFNGVAPIFKEEIKDLIKEHSSNKGFIITDHDYRNILDIATKIVLIHDGATKQIKNKKELIDWGYLPDE
jgi:ABC-type multidrug transport system ATPase subunit